MLVRQTHNPYAAARHIPAPQINGDGPHPGPVRVVAWMDRYVPWQLAGGETAVHAMLAHLVAQGHEVDVATLWPDTLTWDGRPNVVDGVRVWPDSEAERLIDRADVLVGHLLWTKRVIAAAAMGQVPLVYVLHNTFTLEAWGLRATDVTACVYNAEWVAAHHQHRHARWVEVPTAIVRPPVRSADYELEAGDRTDDGFLTLVNPNPDKGAAVFYQLAEERPGDRFLAVAGAYGQQVHPRPPKHRNVTWQHQTPNMRGDVYARTRVLLMPSRYESWGRTGTEALAAGIPVVAHPTEGLLESLGDAGLYADRRRVKDWHQILDMLDDPGFYAEQQARCLERAAELDKVADSDLAGFEWLILSAANAERVPSLVMSNGHDPYRAQSGPPHSVERQTRRPTQVSPSSASELLTALRERTGHGPPPAPGSIPDGPPPADTQPVARPERQPDPGQAAAAAAEEAAADAMVEPAAPAEPDPGEAVGRDGPKLVGEVPERAEDVIGWIVEDGIDDATRYDRAEAAEYVEERRDGRKRTTVVRAYTPVLYE